MKKLTAKNQSKSLNDNIHSALKREFLYAKPIIEGEIYEVGNQGREVQILANKTAVCEYSIDTLDGKFFVQFTTI